jgi:hypothetical protein
MRLTLVAVVFSLVAAACGGTDSTALSTTSVASVTTTTSAPAGVDGGDVILLAGAIQIPAANDFNDPGFHEVFVLTGGVPEAAAGVTGELVVRLRDVGRPENTCDRDHPLSGCATVDWSDFEDRPGVPAGGVFDNHLNVVSSSGPINFFLSENRGLADTPDEYVPT